MIGLFLCWAAGSYWKKIYYVYITLQEILLLLGFGIASTMGEEGDYDPVTGGEMSVIVIALVFLVFMLILYAKNKRMADTFNMFIIMWMSLKALDLMHIVSDIPVILSLLFLIVSVLVPAFVYCSDCYSAVLPSSYFAVFSSMFWGFCVKGTDFLTVKGWKGGLLLWGIGIILTAAGGLIQILILKKTEMGTKKRNKLSEALK